MATALVNRKLTADQMIDDGFNKHNFNHKDGLPTWFLDDEGKYYKPNLPVTKEAIQALRAKQRALDARPIKKVAEAKARKKFKAAARMEKAKRKMDGLTDAPDMSERDKAQQMQKLLGKAAGKPKKKEVSVVVAKGVNRGVKGRPKGVKGRYKIVDPRMRECRLVKPFASTLLIKIWYAFQARRSVRSRGLPSETRSASTSRFRPLVSDSCFRFGPSYLYPSAGVPTVVLYYHDYIHIHRTTHMPEPVLD
jgi:hypothetical protein